MTPSDSLFKSAQAEGNSNSVTYVTLVTFVPLTYRFHTTF